MSLVMGSMGPRFLSAGLLVFDAGLLVISDSISFVSGPVKNTETFLSHPLVLVNLF